MIVTRPKTSYANVILSVNNQNVEGGFQVRTDPSMDPYYAKFGIAT